MILLKNLINHLNGKGIVFVKQVVEIEEASIMQQEWKFVESVGLNQRWKIEWDH